MKKVLVSTTIALLLITVVASATFAAHAAGRELLVKGSIQSFETYVVNFPIMSVTASGSGHASQLGMFTVSYSVQVNLLTNEGTGGVAEFVAANGDRLFAEGTGQATATTTPGVFNITEHYTIVGGTGRFVGASGNITLDRIVNITIGVTDGTMIGNIFLP
jgi:hypothetical protein